VVFGDGGSNSVIVDSNKFNNLEWAYLSNGYLYSAHRAVIFAIAQLSCYLTPARFICLWNLDLSFASCTSCTSAMHDITQLSALIVGKEEELTEA